ncbi:MAG: hypothetical protein N3G20_05510, partial [Verrucomicrobiae bacterium]|nr:hypothetical protein [Verrucomicrobiae bacterium]
QMPAGAVPDQIRKALSSPTVGELSGHLTAIKLYNSGSFFDTRSVPPQDYDAIARLTARFPRVIVECHPALIGSAVLRFRELVAGRLEVAMGLETANLSVLEMLNKRLTPAGFMRAARFLTENDVDVRAFVLIQPPFVSAECAAEMAAESAEFAFQCGASVVSLIPTRSDDGVLQVLERNGYFARPSLHVIERALELSIALGKGRVIVDLWKLDEFAECQACFEARRTRLARMNLTQAAVPRVSCSTCGS